MRFTEHPSFAAAKAASGDGEVVVAFRDRDGTHYAVAPAVVEVDTPRGVKRQPVGEFMQKWWDTVADEARRKAGV